MAAEAAPARRRPRSRRRSGGAALAGAVLALLLPAGAGAELDEAATAACIACHGGAGEPPAAPEIPVLAGQPELYLLYQLVYFRQGQRKDPDMNALVAAMSDDELRALAAWGASLPPPAAAGAAAAGAAAAAAKIARGRELSGRHRCGTCHEPDLSGRAHMPRLAGQQEAYLLKALQDFKAGRRIGIQAAMAEVLAPFSDADLAALAAYMAHAGR